MTKRGIYLGLFFISMGLLLFEIIMTRIFSVATWYYFAFFAISMAMFGITVGSLFVYLAKTYFNKHDISFYLTRYSIYQAISIVLSLLTFLSIPFYPRLSGIGLFSSVLIFVVLSLPFFFGGICVSLCLTRFRTIVGKMYAFDLSGAAVGAILVVPLLNNMDAITAIFCISLITLIGTYFFIKSSEKVFFNKKIFILILIFFIILTGINYFFRFFRVEWVKMRYSQPVEEYWNSISRVAVYPFRWVKYPYNWGLSSEYKPVRPIGEIMIDIDGVSETVMTLFKNRDLKFVEHLKYDVTFLAHYLRKDAKVYIIGVGGGRDILASLLFKQKKIVGVEINKSILNLLKDGKFAIFTGYLEKFPEVKFIEGEARNVITTIKDKFDIIQASCIATWSATTAGAFSLAENSLYTLEAWKIFFEHLTDKGILSFNRWFSVDYPAQLLRLTSLASATLKSFNISDPSKHIVIVRNIPKGRRWSSATILVSKKPFSNEDLDKLDQIAKKMNFKVVYSPKNKNPLFQRVIDNIGNPDFFKKQPLNLAPPTDNQPYFFHMLRLKDAFNKEKLKFREQSFNLKSINILLTLLIISIILSIIFIILPPIIYYVINEQSKNLTVLRKTYFMSIFFLCIGFGYILIEIGLIQRLVVFLGHPTYSITVVVFSLLLASGAGSLVSNRIIEKGKDRVAIYIILILLIVQLITLLAIPNVVQKFITENTFIKIMLALLIIVPAGFLMGFPFPMGMNIVLKKYSEYGPWFWAVNGAASVVASVIATAISIAYGIDKTLMIGFIAYIGAFLCFTYFVGKTSYFGERM